MHQATLRRRMFIVALLAVCCCSAFLSSAAPQEVQTLPDVTFRTYQNETVRTADMKGNVLFVEFWSTNCKACSEMRTATERLNDQFAAKGVMFLSINEDVEHKTWEEFLIHKPSPLIEVRDVKHSFRRTWHVTSVPAALIVDRGGQIRWRRPWTSASEPQASETLTRLLQEH